MGRRSREAAFCLFQVHRNEGDDPEFASGGSVRQGTVQCRIGQEAHDCVRVGWEHARGDRLEPLVPCHALRWKEVAVQRMDQVKQERKVRFLQLTLLRNLQRLMTMSWICRLRVLHHAGKEYHWTTRNQTVYVRVSLTQYSEASAD